MCVGSQSQRYLICKSHVVVFWLYSHLAPINCQCTVVGNDKDGDNKITGSVYIRWTCVEDDMFFDCLMLLGDVQSGA